MIIVLCAMFFLQKDLAHTNVMQTHFLAMAKLHMPTHHKRSAPNHYDLTECHTVKYLDLVKFKPNCLSMVNWSDAHANNSPCD